MVWVRIDDHFDEHPKFAKAGPLGLALWAAGLAYCNRNGNDGMIPWAKAMSLLSWQFLGDAEVDKNGGSKRQVYRIGLMSGHAAEEITSEFVAGLLVSAELWEQVDGGYRIHDYAEYQFTADELVVRREKKATAGRAGGLATAARRHLESSNILAGATADAKQVLQQNPSPDPVPGPVKSLTPVELLPERARRSPPVDEAFIVRMVAEYGKALDGNDGVRDEIDAALNHKSSDKVKNRQLYVQRWLTRACGFRNERRNRKSTGTANVHY